MVRSVSDDHGLWRFVVLEDGTQCGLFGVGSRPVFLYAILTVGDGQGLGLYPPITQYFDASGRRHFWYLGVILLRLLWAESVGSDGTDTAEVPGGGDELVEQQNLLQSACGRISVRSWAWLEGVEDWK